MCDLIHDKILNYYNEIGRKKYHYGNYLNPFLDGNPEVKEYVEGRLQEEPWYEGKASNVIWTVSHDIYGPAFCRTCGKPIKIKSVLHGCGDFCSGGCKSKNPAKKLEAKAEREKREKAYEIDKSMPLDGKVIEEFRSRGNAPSDDVKRKIEEYAKQDSKGIGLYNLLNGEPDVDEYLCNLARILDRKDKKEAFWYAKNGLYNGVLCRTCGRQLPFFNARTGHEYCSIKCAQNNDDTRDKMRRTCIDRYGGDNPMRSQEVLEKHRNVILQLYGVENVSLSPEICEKRRRVIQERYGVNAYTQTKEYKEKVKKTNLERYGVDWASKSKYVQDKMKATNLERYGVENVFESEHFKMIINRKVLDASYDRIVEKYGDHVMPLFSKEEYVGMQKSVYKWKCMKCGCEFEDYMHTTSAFRRMSPFPLCPICYPPMSDASFLEKEVLEFVRSICDDDVIENNRTAIAPLELDIYVPKRHIAIEFDGLYWHSEAAGKTARYHLEKTEKCIENGIRLIHVFKNEWMEHQEIVKDRIRSAFGIYDERIYARRCRVKSITREQSNSFLEKNHLQGGDRSALRYGLYYGKRLVAVMTFGKPRFNSNYDWELIRFASLKGVQVVGGAGKLLAAFRKKHAGSIISYADRRYSNGNLYESLGFTRIGVSSPNYLWVKKTLYLTRYQCQKHLLPALLGELFRPEESEAENMTACGWSRIFDCGNLIYAMERKPRKTDPERLDESGQIPLF